MNSVAHMNNPARRLENSMQCLWLCGLLCLLMSPAAMATDALWPPADQLGQVFNYTIPGNPPPIIDATAFDNENQFTINASAGVANAEIFKTWNTVNYTNNGLMVANSPISTNGLFLSESTGCGFDFDTVTTNVISERMAGIFYNPGVIRVNSVTDTGGTFSSLATVGIFKVWATNVINPGSVAVGVDGLLQFTGQSVNLARSQLSLENLNTELNVLTNFFPGLNFLVPLNLSVLNTPLPAAVGSETNYIDPAVDFSLPNPTSDDFLPPLYLGLQNATAYVQTNAISTNQNLVRAVFISNPIPGVTNHVYFDYGDILVQWVGNYVNPATGLQTNNFMYLEDDFGEITNLQLAGVGGGPINYSWLANWPLILGPPAPSGLPIGTFTVGSVTNDFAYESVQLIATTVATNASLQNPSGALTNLVGRIQINASHDLDLSLAQISGPNYMSLTATNQFNGSGGAAIFSPYSDFNLGVTNGFLSISNLLAPSVPNWNGPCQVFSARWQTVDATGVTNIYHVLLLNSDAVPTTTPTVQDLILHSTNLVVSDTFNIIRKLSIDATSLTLTTNLDTSGIGSQDGELNWYGPTALNSVQFPNLRWVTNNGAIRAANLAVFGSSWASGYGAFNNNGLLADQGTTIYATNFLSSGAISNGVVGSFNLHSATTVLTNGVIAAGGDVSIITGSLLTSNLVLQAGRSLTLSATNLLTDGIASGSTSVTNGNIWTVGSVAISNGKGLSLPVNPTNGDLLGTTITNIAPAGVVFTITSAGNDYGVSTAGFTNNMAIGRLILDGKNLNSLFTFKGTGGAGVSNAIYVDYLEFDDSTANNTSYNFPGLSINTNITVYFAQAMLNGVSVAEKIDNASRYNGRNNGRLRWVPSYVGHFSSTNIVYPGGATNTVNAALAQSTDIDSDGDGIANASDPTPFFLASDLIFTETLTNVPPKSILLSWQTIPGATNYVYYKTNLVSTGWSLLQTNASLPANPFISPQPEGSSATNVSVLDPVNPAQPKFYKVTVQPWLTYPY